MKKSSFVFAALLTWGVSAMAQTMAFPDGAAPLTPEALREALSGKVFAVSPAKGPVWRWQFDADSLFSIKIGNYSDSGKWSTKDSSICQETPKNSGCNEIRGKDNVLYLKRDNGEVVALKAQ